MADVQRRLTNILNKVNNKVCADCDAKNPRWVSLTLGVLVCIRCCGMHRNLGTHISKMKSVTLDKFLPDWCYIFECLDNTIANDHWERNRPSHLKRPTESSSSSEVERFIRDKYEFKRWAPTSEDSPVKCVLNGSVKQPSQSIPLPSVPQPPAQPQSVVVLVPQQQSLDLLSIEEPPFDPFPQSKTEDEEMVWHSAPAPVKFPTFETMPAPAFQPPIYQAPSVQVFQPPVMPTVYQPSLTQPPAFQPPPQQNTDEKEANIRAILSMYQQPQAQVRATPAPSGFIPLGAIAAEQMMRGAPGIHAWPSY